LHSHSYPSLLCNDYTKYFSGTSVFHSVKKFHHFAFLSSSKKGKLYKFLPFPPSSRGTNGKWE
jgi:hypothetical protein